MQQGKERGRVKRGYFAAIRLLCSLRSGRAELPVISQALLLPVHILVS